MITTGHGMLQKDTLGLLDSLNKLNIDMIALIKPEADFVQEIRLCQDWLDGISERTSKNLQIIPVHSSVVSNEEIFPRNKDNCWQVYRICRTASR